MPTPRLARRALHAASEGWAARRAAPRWAAFELLRHLTPIVGIPQRGGGRLLVHTGDRGIGRLAYSGLDPDGPAGGGVAGVANLIRGEYGDSFLRGKTLVDVGANVGLSTVAWLRDEGMGAAVAVEPEPDNWLLLRANMVLAGLEDRVQAVRAVASDAAGTVQLELSARNWGDHRVRVGAAGTEGAYREGTRDCLPVTAEPLDTILVAAGVEPSQVGLLWVDTQGHEGQVLAGAGTVLKAGMPVCVEYWPYGLRRAGGLDLLHEQVGGHFAEAIDVRATARGGRPVRMPANDVAQLVGKYPAEAFTDLLLLP